MLLNCYKPIIYYICANNTYFMHDSVLTTKDGTEVFSFEYIDRVRRKRSDKRIIAQRGCQEKFLATNADITIFGGNRGGPLLVDTKVVTPFGYRRIGDLKAGDIISATDGGMQRVVYRQDHGKLPAYRVTFIDGSSVIASYDHLWNVKLHSLDEWVTLNTQQVLGWFKRSVDVYIPICNKTKTSYKLNISGECAEPIDELYDKWYSRFANALKNEVVDKRRIVNIEYVGEQECCCIAVDNANSLFMVEDFIVTHNSKSFSLLMESLKDINNSHFNAILLRNERDDLQDLVNTSYQLYSPFGTYNRSINDMTWNYYNGGKLKFSYYAGGYEDFETRFRGRQYSYIGIDEITQIAYKKFKFLVTCNRNAYGIRNRFYGTCNPDPDSWVRKFIDWWIDEDGLPIPDRDGVVRYCFMDGDTPDQIYWGSTPDEVYEQCKDIIDPLWKEEYESLGFNKVTMFVKSVTFIKGKLEENIALISSDPNYVANLAQQDEEQRARDLEGNWNFKRTGDDMIKMEDMERMFSAAEQTMNGVRYVSADIAFEGGDFCVMWLWEGLHIKDLFVMRENSANTEAMFAAKLLEWGVREENVVYDYWGVGQALSGHFKRAVKFTGTERPKEPFDKSYKNVKSQCAEMLAHFIQDGKISIEPRLLDLRFSGKKGKYSNTPLRQILMKERKCIRHKENSSIGGFELINKEGMIKAVGYSPDFFESLIYRMIFDVKTQHKKPKGLWML